MRRTRKLKITVEKERFLVLRHEQEVEQWCTDCRAMVRMIRPAAAAAVAAVSDRTIFRQIESRRLHFSETQAGAVLICLNSIMEQNREGKENQADGGARALSKKTAAGTD
jgi:hypothetical protein